MKALIVDDEGKVRKAIRSIIELCFLDIKDLREAKSVSDALKILDHFKPDVIFLDVHLGDGTGFDILNNMRSQPGKVIFITAYDQYAIQAFKYSAVDYLLKPVSQKDLMQSINRVKQQTQSQQEVEENNRRLLNFIGAEFVNKIVLRTSRAIHVIQRNDIIRCEADVNYTIFHLKNKKKIIVSKTLKEIEKELLRYGFIRTHRAHLINKSMIKTYHRSRSSKIILQDGSEVPVSIRKREDVLKLFQKYKT